MRGVTDVAEGALEIELFEGDSAQAAGLLFSSRLPTTSGETVPDRRSSTQALVSLRSFVVRGRTLALQFDDREPDIALLRVQPVQKLKLGVCAFGCRRPEKEPRRAFA